MGKTGIIIASFGTTNLSAIENNIQKCEDVIRSHFNSYKVQRAFTSTIVKKRVLEKFNIHVDNVQEALEKMKNEKYQSVVIQPLHIIPGKEFHEILETAKSFEKDFKRIIVGKPLLHSINDYDLVINAVIKIFSGLKRDQAVVLMGHGSAHPANSCYACLQLKLSDNHENFFIACVDGYPELKDILPKLRRKNIHEITLMPFMIVSGEHVMNDMASNESYSWKEILMQNGFTVEVTFMGLGEINGIQEIFINHIKDAFDNL